MTRGSVERSVFRLEPARPLLDSYVMPIDSSIVIYWFGGGIVIADHEWIDALYTTAAAVDCDITDCDLDDYESEQALKTVLGTVGAACVCTPPPVQPTMRDVLISVDIFNNCAFEKRSDGLVEKLSFVYLKTHISEYLYVFKYYYIDERCSLNLQVGVDMITRNDFVDWFKESKLFLDRKDKSGDARVDGRAGGR